MISIYLIYIFSIGINLKVGIDFSLQKPRKVHYCNHCSYKTLYSTHLKKHLYIHTNERPYQCQSCNSSFSTKGSLVRHSVKHYMERSNDY